MNLYTATPPHAVVLDTVAIATHLNNLAVCDQVPNAGSAADTKVTSICRIETLADLRSLGRFLYMKTSYRINRRERR